MAQLNGVDFLAKFINGVSGLFKTNGTKAIKATELQAFTTDIEGSFLNILDDFVDEDNMVSNSATKVPSQQSVKSYVDAKDHNRMSYDLSTGAYPTAGGSGAAGVPAIGDWWYGINSGDFNVQDLGLITLNRGALLIYIGGDVTLPASWIVKQ